MSSVFDERNGKATACLEVDLFGDPRTWDGEQPELKIIPWDPDEFSDFEAVDDSEDDDFDTMSHDGHGSSRQSTPTSMSRTSKLMNTTKIKSNTTKSKTTKTKSEPQASNFLSILHSDDARDHLSVASETTTRYLTASPASLSTLHEEECGPCPECKVDKSVPDYLKGQRYPTEDLPSHIDYFHSDKERMLRWVDSFSINREEDGGWGSREAFPCPSVGCHAVFAVASAFAQHVVTAHIRDTGPPPMLDPEFMLALATAAASGAGDLARYAKSHMRRLEKEAGVVHEEKVVVVRRRKKRSPN